MDEKLCTKCGQPMGAEEGDMHAVCPTPAEGGKDTAQM